MKKIVALTFLSIFLFACAAQSGPDKTVAGSVLGAGWGAGAGAVIGNQVDNTGTGAGIGAGFGLVSGAMSGAQMDAYESDLLQSQNELEALRVQNVANSKQLARLQYKMDEAVSGSSFGGFYQVFFDSDSTSLRAGTVANLEAIGDAIKGSPYAMRINVIGHSDDAGSPEYNQTLAEARARAVSAYLTSRGISSDQVVVKNYGALRPIASNATDVGRQLNRRVDIFVTR